MNVALPFGHFDPQPFPSTEDYLPRCSWTKRMQCRLTLDLGLASLVHACPIMSIMCSRIAYCISTLGNSAHFANPANPPNLPNSKKSHCKFRNLRDFRESEQLKHVNCTNLVNPGYSLQIPAPRPARGSGSTTRVRRCRLWTLDLGLWTCP